MACAQLGQCGGGGFDLLVFSLGMDRTRTFVLIIGGSNAGAPSLVAKSIRLS